MRSGPFDGYLLVGQSKQGVKGAAFSADDGITWTEGPIDPDESFGVPSVFLSLPEGPHADRILAGAINGIAYSDGGASWTLSELWIPLGREAYAFAYVAKGPLAGRLYAGVADTSYGRLYWSDDGGQTWTPQREFGGQRFRFVEGADGSVGPSAVGNPGGVLLVITEGGERVALSLPERTEVRVTIYDVLGREVAVLHDGPLAAGTQVLRFSDGGLPSGLYVVRVTTDGFTTAQRFTLVR